MFLKFAMPALAFGATFIFSDSSQAATMLYTSRDSFVAATVAAGTDTFSDLSGISDVQSPLSRTAGTFSYVASSASTFFGVGTNGETWLSTNDAVASISFSQFSGGATAIGGNFFGSDIAGGFASGDMTLIASSANGSVEWTITNAVVTSFVGFVSTEPILSLALRAEQPPTLLWPTVDNLTLAGTEVLAVPEPGTFGLLMAGLAVLGLKRWRSSWWGCAFFVRAGRHLKSRSC